MELLSVISLFATGLYLNKNKNKNNNYNYNYNIDNNNVGNNIYDSNDFLKHKQLEFKKVNNNFKLSFNPYKTNIIPRYINSLHENNNMIKNSNYDPTLIYDVINSFDDNTKKIIYTLKSNNCDKDENLINPECNIEQIGGSLLPNRGYENNDMTHNNMVPFYRGKITQNMDDHNQYCVNKLETFTGQKKLNIPQKKEVEQFFAPVANMTNINGYVEKRDLERYIPSTLGKANNELPFEQITVGKGLNDGYTSKPSGGFHNPLRILPPTIEQLQIDPVLETEGRILAGKSINKRKLLEFIICSLSFFINSFISLSSV